MKKILLILSLSFLFVSNVSFSEEYKLPNIKPKDLVNDGYVLHSITPISEEGPRVMLYTFVKNKTKIVSCVIELFDVAEDLHTCYNVTNQMNKTQYPEISEVNSNEESFRIFFDGGDLGKRKNVNNLNDFIECQKLFDIEFDKVGGFPNLKEFYWSINYQIPDLEQYEKDLGKAAFECEFGLKFNI